MDRYVPTERNHRVLFGAGRRFSCHIRRRLVRYRDSTHNRDLADDQAALIPDDVPPM